MASLLLKLGNSFEESSEIAIGFPFPSLPAIFPAIIFSNEFNNFELIASDEFNS